MWPSRASCPVVGRPRRNAFAPLLVGHADDRGVCDVGVGAQYFLDLECGHLLAAALDDVDRSPTEQPVTVGLADCHVAGAEPAVDERGVGGLGIVPVLGEHVRSAHEQFARSAVEDIAQRVVDDARASTCGSGKPTLPGTRLVSEFESAMPISVMP